MKNVLILAFIFLTQNLWAVCSSPISRTNNSPTAVLSSTKYNLDANTVYSRVNNLPGDCIADATIATSKLQDESVTAAKIAADVLARFIPAGAVIAYAGASAPAGFLLCNGQAVSRTTYADLYSAIGTSHGSGNGSTTFNVPDYRGRFLRGVDGGAGRDPDRASRAAMASGGNAGDLVGSVQSDEFASHTHTVSGYGLMSIGNAGGTWVGGASGNGGSVTTIPNTGGNETRPENANVFFVIKY